MVKEFRNLKVVNGGVNKEKKDYGKELQSVMTGEVCTFKPKINEMSQILGEMNYQKYKQIPMEDLELENPVKPVAEEQPNASPKKSQKMSYIVSPNSNDRVDVLYKKEVIKEMKLQDKKERIKREAMKECTFQPNCSKNPDPVAQRNYLMNRSNVSQNDLIDRLYNDQREKYEILQEIRHAEEEKKQMEKMKNCTFHPRINNYSLSNLRSPLTKSNAPRDFYKAVGRMRFATEEREKKKEALEHIPAGEGYEQRMKEPFNPPRCAQIVGKENKKSSKKVKPFMYLDVNISAGKTGRIALYKDDDPVLKGQSFAQTFQLNEEMEEGLINLLRTYLENQD